MKFIKSYIRAIKYVKSLATFKEESIPSIVYNDETYQGLDGNDTIVRIFYTNNVLNTQYTYQLSETTRVRGVNKLLLVFLLL